jgi:DNA-binding transcriptional MerR regulator
VVVYVIYQAELYKKGPMKLAPRQLTIQQLSDQLQLPKSTIRFWEKEFNSFIAPERTSGGQRRYTSQHIIRFDQIRKLRDAGQSIDEIKKSLVEYDHTEMNHQNSEQIKVISNRIGQIVSDELYKLLSVELVKRT